MNRERAKELLPVITAFAEGKDIESSYDSSNVWFARPDPSWAAGLEYRVKTVPVVPREFVVYPRGMGEYGADVADTTTCWAGAIKVREILDD